MLIDIFDFHSVVLWQSPNTDVFRNCVNIGYLLTYVANPRQSFTNVSYC